MFCLAHGKAKWIEKVCNGFVMRIDWWERFFFMLCVRLRYVCKTWMRRFFEMYSAFSAPAPVQYPICCAHRVHSKETSLFLFGKCKWAFLFVVLAWSEDSVINFRKSIRERTSYVHHERMMHIAAGCISTSWLQDGMMKTETSSLRVFCAYVECFWISERFTRNWYKPTLLLILHCLQIQG